MKIDVPTKEAITPITKKVVSEKGTPIDPIPIEETPEEREAAATEKARLHPVLRRSAATRLAFSQARKKRKC